MTSTPRAQHGYSYHPAADRWLQASRVEDSLIAPETARSSARRFNDAQNVTWWVHLVRPGVETEIIRHERLQAVMLRFQNGEESRYLHPIPPDWRECDEMLLCRYCEQAKL